MGKKRERPEDVTSPRYWFLAAALQAVAAIALGVFLWWYVS